VVAPDPREFENLRRTLKGIPSRSRQPLALIPGTLTGILYAPGETFPAKLPQRLRDIGPQDGYIRDAFTGILTGSRQPLALVICTTRESRLKAAHENLHFLQEPHSSISP
jgi:hypothetical protein